MEAGATAARAVAEGFGQNKSQKSPIVKEARVSVRLGLPLQPYYQYSSHSLALRAHFHLGTYALE